MMIVGYESVRSMGVDDIIGAETQKVKIQG